MTLRFVVFKASCDTVWHVLIQQKVTEDILDWKSHSFSIFSICSSCDTCADSVPSVRELYYSYFAGVPRLGQGRMIPSDCTRGRRAIWNTHSGEKSNTREAGVPSAAKQVIIEARVSKQNSDHKPLMEIPTDPRNGLGRLNAHVSAVLPAASHLCTFAQILLEPKGLWLNLTNFWLHWIHIARSYFKALLSIVRNWRPDGAGSGQLIRASSAEVKSDEKTGPGVLRL